MSPSGKKRKVCVVVANRANYARIKTFLEAAKSHPNLELCIIASASTLLDRFGTALNVMKSDGFDPSSTLHTVVEGENPETMAQSTGLALIQLPAILRQLQPDVVLTVADRYETIATAIAASYMNITLAHTQGGEVSGSIDEGVRHAITKLAHIHFPATQLSAERVKLLGEDAKFVYMVGCPSIDLADRAGKRANALIRGYSLLHIDPDKPFLVVMQHPVTTEYGSTREQITETLEALRNIRLPKICIYPNVDAGSEDIIKGIRSSKLESQEGWYFYKNMPPEVFAALLSKCACVVGNSSSGIRESAFFGTPSINIGSRQHNRERGNNVVDVAYDRRKIYDGILQQLEHGKYPVNHLFGDGHAGEKIADILATCELRVQKTLSY